MAMQDVPIPAELEPTSPDDEWLDALLDWAEAYATEADVEPADLAGEVGIGNGDGLVPQLAWAEQARRWTVADDGSADWAMAKYAAADAALAELRQQADAWADEAQQRLHRIRAWFTHRAKRHLATQAFMEAHLVRYALDRREADPKRNKSLVLPSGAVRTTETKPKAEVADQDAVVAWAVQLGGERLADIAPEQPRKLYVQALRDNTSVVEVVDRAQLLLASGELVTWVRDGSVPDGEDVPDDVAVGRRCPQPGDGWPSPDDATDLVARVEVLASHLEVHGPDGLPVPGTHVNPGGVTAKVVPA